MIELITGLPGAGKTLYSIERAMAYRAEGRRVYYIGINQLDEAKTGVLPFPGTLEEWGDKLVAGDVLIVDEVQQYLPAVVRRDGTPAWIERLTRNRHDGIDLVFVTQHPKLIDSFVRRLVNRHEHLINIFGKQEANLYTWIQVCEEPESKAQRTMADCRKWHYPTRLYDLYRSAELHTRKEHVPRMVRMGKYALWASVAFAAFAVWWLYGMWSYSRKHQPVKAAAADSAEPSFLGGVKPGRETARELTPAEWLRRQTPRFSALPWSAPLWDSLKPQTSPDMYCMAIEAGDDHDARCICHTEQGTRLNVEDKLCHVVARYGQYNPYRVDSATRRRDDSPRPPAGDKGREPLPSKTAALTP